MNSFAERWVSKERECGLEGVAARMIPIANTFLPDSAAPCLSFDYAAAPAPIYEVFGAPSDWTASDRARLLPYFGDRI